MMLVEPHSRSYTRVSVDDLGSPEHPVFAGYQSFTPEDYQLECCLDDSHYFIMAPSGVVMGRSVHDQFLSREGLGVVLYSVFAGKVCVGNHRQKDLQINCLPMLLLKSCLRFWIGGFNSEL